MILDFSVEVCHTTLVVTNFSFMKTLSNKITSEKIPAKVKQSTGDFLFDKERSMNLDDPKKAIYCYELESKMVDSFRIKYNVGGKVYEAIVYSNRAKCVIFENTKDGEPLIAEYDDNKIIGTDCGDFYENDDGTYSKIKYYLIDWED